MEKIKELIASGEYTTGGRLPTEQEMAERFGVGRSSIREAIKTFNYLGVLESKTAKGTFVCDSNSISSETLTWAILLGTDALVEADYEFHHVIIAEGSERPLLLPLRNAAFVYVRGNSQELPEDPRGRRPKVISA